MSAVWGILAPAVLEISCHIDSRLNFFKIIICGKMGQGVSRELDQLDAEAGRCGGEVLKGLFKLDRFDNLMSY